jgi:hypothetical protein
MESNRVDDLSACPKTLRGTCITLVQHSDEFGRTYRFWHGVNLFPRLGTIELPTTRLNRHAHLPNSESQLHP